jgi:ParB/RepB/Spo0J family partition protein
MTTTIPTSAGEAVGAAPVEAATALIAAHPDNPRRQLGDLTELVRSMKTHGVLQPLLVLPADERGMHLIVAGHRRHAAVISSP